MSKGKTDTCNFSRHVFIYLGCNFHLLKTADLGCNFHLLKTADLGCNFHLLKTADLGCNFHLLKTAVDICRRWHDLSDSVNFQNEDGSPSDENQQATDSGSQVGTGGIEWWK